MMRQASHRNTSVCNQDTDTHLLRKLTFTYIIINVKSITLLVRSAPLRTIFTTSLSLGVVFFVKRNTGSGFVCQFGCQLGLTYKKTLVYEFKLLQESKHF